MVNVYIGEGTPHKRIIRIVSKNGQWPNDLYKLYNSHFLTDEEATTLRIINLNKLNVLPDNKNPDYLGDISFDYENGNWEYRGNKLTPAEQNEIANFIYDYKAPDAVY